MSIKDTKTRQRVLIVDNHPLVRRGLTELIEAEPDMTVCAAADTYRAALDRIDATHPDLVITELSLETSDDGLLLLKNIRSKWPDLPVLVLTMHAPSSYTELALAAGATGYVTKTEGTDTLVNAIHRVLMGERYVNPNIVGEYELH